MSYWQLYYHLVFATRERRPFLAASLRLAAARLLTEKATELRCTVHALHVQPDHVHMVLSIPPTAAVATVVGQLKGSSSHALARVPEGDGFRWQEEYGILSFGRRNLPDVARYVNDQDRRHAQRDLAPELERSGDVLSAPNHDRAATATPSAGLSRLRDRSPVIYDREGPRDTVPAVDDREDPHDPPPTIYDRKTPYDPCPAVNDWEDPDDLSPAIYDPDVPYDPLPTSDQPSGPLAASPFVPADRRGNALVCGSAAGRTTDTDGGRHYGRDQ